MDFNTLVCVCYTHIQKNCASAIFVFCLLLNPPSRGNKGPASVAYKIDAVIILFDGGCGVV